MHSSLAGSGTSQQQAHWHQTGIIAGARSLAPRLLTLHCISQLSSLLADIHSNDTQTLQGVVFCSVASEQSALTVREVAVHIAA
jgi:hypothetical protein